MTTRFDETRKFKHFVYGAILGALAIAALDFGDVWVCAGDCQRMIKLVKDIDS